MANKYLSNLILAGGPFTVTPDTVYTTYNVGDEIYFEKNSVPVNVNVTQFKAWNEWVIVELLGAGEGYGANIQPQTMWSQSFLDNVTGFKIAGASLPILDAGGNIIGFNQVTTAQLNWDVSYTGV